MKKQAQTGFPISFRGSSTEIYVTVLHVYVSALQPRCELEVLPLNFTGNAEKHCTESYFCLKEDFLFKRNRLPVFISSLSLVIYLFSNCVGLSDVFLAGEE